MFKVTLLSVVVSKGGIRFFGRRDVHFLGTSQIFFGKRPHLAFKSFNLFFGSGENTSTSRLELAPLPVFGIMKPVVSHTRICWMQMKRMYEGINHRCSERMGRQQICSTISDIVQNISQISGKLSLF